MLNVYDKIVFHKANYLDYKCIIDKYYNVLQCKHWQCCFYKYEIFKMVKYDKILYLDGDMIVDKDIFDIFDDENEVNSAMKKYRELMRPAYKAGGYIERDDNALYYDTDSFTKMIKNLKLSLNFAHVDYSV